MKTSVDRFFCRSRTLSFVIFTLSLPALAVADRPVYRGADLFRDLAENRTGIPVMAKASRILVQKSQSLKLTKSAIEVYEFADSIIQGVDLSEMLTTPLAVTLPDKWRALSLHGEDHGKNFIVDYHKGTIDHLTPASLADFGFEFRIREDQIKLPQNEDGYGIMLRSKLNMGELSHRTFLRLLSGMLRIMAPENVATLPAVHANETLDGRGLNEAHATIPAVMTLVDRYSTIHPGMQLKTFASDQRPYNSFSTKLVGNFDHLEEDYPHLGAFLENITSLFDLTVQMRFLAPNGMKLVTVAVDSSSRSLTIQGLDRDGRLVPVDAKGLPHPEASVDPEKVTVWDDVIEVDASGSVLGLTFKEQGVTIAGRFRDGPVATIASKFTKIPQPSIEGRALGIFPIWAIDLTIPGSIEEYARSFTQGMMVGSRGKGTYAAGAIDTTKPGQTAVLSEGSTELVDNFFINFGLRVAQKYIWPNKPVVSEAWDLSQVMVAALAKDLAKLQAAEGQVAH